MAVPEQRTDRSLEELRAAVDEVQSGLHWARDYL
jgi:hypothetical protein